MGRLWTDLDEEHWRAVFEKAADPQDFMLARDINTRDRVRGLARYVVAAIKYRIVGGWKPLSLRQHIESINIERQIGPARMAENVAFLKEQPCDFGDFDWFDG